MSVDISKLSAAELEKLRNSIDNTIDAKKQEEKQKVVEQIRDILAKNGMSWDDLPRGRGGRSNKNKGTKVAPKYRDPKNAGNTWTGRGRKPLWVVDFLAKGGSLKKLEIKK